MFTSLRVRHQSARPQRGFGMVEVLVAMLILAVGIVGLARFQGLFMRDSGAAKAHAIAAQLAREKMDDLKSYTQLPAGTVAGVFGYADIGTDVGGSETTAGTLRLPTGTVSFPSGQYSNTTYNRSWTSTPFYYCADNTAPSTANCTVAKPSPDFKALRVTVAWTDPDDTSQTLAFDDVAGDIDPSSVGSAVVSGATQSPPIIQYVPGTAPNIIAIDIGGGQKKETSMPAPTLKMRGQTIINVIARYDTVSYNASSNTLKRESFTTLNCSCTQSGAGTGRNLKGKFVAKRVGVPSDQFQATECSVCCRDHHDDSTCVTGTDTGKANCYDPFRPTTDYVTSGVDHNHYTANGVLANNVGDTYVEACRIKRVSGDLQVAQDWNLVALSLIPNSFFANGSGPIAANVTSYGTYVKDYVQAYLSGGTLPTPPWPQTSTIDKTNPLTTKQYSGRAIYVDYLTDATKTAYVARINANDASVYQQIPFYEVNQTKIARWSPVYPTSPGPATVTSEALVAELPGQNLYSRGLVTARQVGINNIYSVMRIGNTGVIDQFISTDPNDASIQISVAHEVTVPGANPTLTGTIIASGSTPTIPSPGPSVIADNCPSCCIVTLSSATYTYNCTVPFGWDGSITPMVAAGGYVFSPPASPPYTNVTQSGSAQSFTYVASTTNYTVSGTIDTTLPNLMVTPTANTGAMCSLGTGNYSCTVPANWNGSITPSANGYSFSPANYSTTGATGPATQNFTATAIASSFAITGSITPAVNGPINFTTTGGASCTYVVNATSYSCTVPSGASGTITPSAATTAGPIIFTPNPGSFAAVTSSGPTAPNFTSSPSACTISGLITPDTSGTAFTLNPAAGTSCTYTAAVSPATSGSYSCTVPNGFAGSVTPNATGKTFTASVTDYSGPGRAVTCTSTGSGNAQTNYAVANTPTPTYTISGRIDGFSNNNNTAPFINCSTGARTLSAKTGSGNNYGYDYSCTTVVQNANLIITPTPFSSGSGNNQKQATYNPPSIQINPVTTDVSGKNFSCTGQAC